MLLGLNNSLKLDATPRTHLRTSVQSCAMSGAF
jgi:hypothetical protein